MMITSIPTTYKKTEFRSKLEAKWAQFFDSINMNWVYEIEGYKLTNGTWYLPDFWLPDCKTFFEVKGPLAEKDDIEKVRRLAMDVAHKNIMVMMGGVLIPKSIALVYPFPAYKDSDDGHVEVFGFIDANGFGYDKTSFLEYKHIRLGACNKCKRPYLIHLQGSYSCRNCGYYDGDNSLDIFYDPEL